LIGDNKLVGKILNFKRFGFILMLVVLGSLALVACGDNTATTAPATTAATTHTPAELAGESKPLGGGAARSWVRLDGAGNPSSVGISLSEAALTNLPTSLEGNEVVLGMPKQNLALPFDHISIEWNPQGHEPPGIYDKPHFDFHFYMISPEEQKTILPTDGVSAKQPEKEAIPTDYIAPQPIAVPAMGVHWLDKAAPELNKQPFTTTFIYGFVKGNMAFAEPMITKAFLESKPDMTANLKLPANYPKAGLYYPTKYSVKYDVTEKEYTIALEGLTLR
jgi:hypothetical protein